MSLHCNPRNTYTFYFNILFIISLIIFNKSYLQGLGLHIIPWFLIAEYLVWVKGLWGSCPGRSRTKVILGDIFGHWLPFIIYLYLLISGTLETGKYTIYGFISPFIVFLLYMIIMKFNMRVYNNIYLLPYLIAYLILLAITTGIWCFLGKNDTEYLYISTSEIHGKGLFANKDYKKDDIIIKDVFANKPPNDVWGRTISHKSFYDGIITHGRYINHCEEKANSVMIRTDRNKFPLIATKNIKAGSEITANYDEISKKIPFIEPAKQKYKKC